LQPRFDRPHGACVGVRAGAVLFRRAEDATSAITKHLRSAENALRRGLATNSAAVNALGVLMEPRLRLNDLTEAREQIDKALEKLRSSSWPTDSDYRDYDFS
jgi:hypothetical protein